MPSAAPSFLLLPFFVATKKMKLLSGNPDGFALVIFIVLQRITAPQHENCVSVIRSASLFSFV